MAKTKAAKGRKGASRAKRPTTSSGGGLKGVDRTAYVRLHILWRWAVDLPGYDKKQWLRLEAEIRKLGTRYRGLEQLCDSLTRVIARA